MTDSNFTFDKNPEFWKDLKEYIKYVGEDLYSQTAADKDMLDLQEKMREHMKMIKNNSESQIGKDYKKEYERVVGLWEQFGNNILDIDDFQLDAVGLEDIQGKIDGFVDEDSKLRERNDQVNEDNAQLIRDYNDLKASHWEIPQDLKDEIIAKFDNKDNHIMVNWVISRIEEWLKNLFSEGTLKSPEPSFTIASEDFHLAEKLMGPAKVEAYRLGLYSGIVYVILKVDNKTLLPEFEVRKVDCNPTTFLKKLGKERGLDLSKIVKEAFSDIEYQMDNETKMINHPPTESEPKPLLLKKRITNIGKSCSECGKEFILFSDDGGTNEVICFNWCPYCGKGNDIWLNLKPDKSSLLGVNAEKGKEIEDSKKHPQPTESITANKRVEEKEDQESV